MTNSSVETGPRVPYVSWVSFWTFIEDLRTSGHAPQVIDASVWGNNRSGAVRSQLGIALKFLGLMNDDGTVTNALNALVSAATPEDELRPIIEEKYAPLFALDLKTATPKQLNEKLMEMGSGEGETLKKSRSFFTSAAQKVGLELGPYVKKASGTKKATSTRKRRSPSGAAPANQSPQPSRSTGDRFETVLRSSGGRGKIEINVTFPLFDLDEDDVEFVMALRRMVLDYSKGAGLKGTSSPS